MKDTPKKVGELSEAIFALICEYEEDIDKTQLIGTLEVIKRSYITTWADED